MMSPQDLNAAAHSNWEQS